MSIVALMTFLLKQVALLVAGAFVLLTLSPVQDINFRRASISNRLFLIIFFGILGILGTSGGNAIFDSFANLRAMAVITAGLFGGPLVGLGAGLVAGGHRFLIDPWGFSAIACALATVLEGLAAGYLNHWLKEKAMDWSVAFLLTLVGETMHMGLVLLLSRPFDDALALVRVIMLPMLIGNSLGTVLFVHVLNSIQALRERKASDHTQKIFEIANSTVPHLRSGLNEGSAHALARIILEQLPVAAVSVTDAELVLAHVGEGSDHHLPGAPFVTKATFQVIQTGEAIFLKEAHSIGCSHNHCPFSSAIIVPLKKNDAIVGTLKFYGSPNHELNSILFEIAKGLTDLFSIQLELQDIQVKDRLLAHAEIRHLQAQINPHFLFNSLNTIASFCRTAPDRARDLIIDLSSYMRKNLDSSRGFIPLSDELDQIQAYLAIEKARFGERIRVQLEIEQGCEDWPIPSLIIQPLVENAVKHGLRMKQDGGIVGLRISKDCDHLHVTVFDDGAGIPDDILGSLLTRRVLESQHGGVGLRNSNLRLENIYGTEHGMQISSAHNRGTSISFTIPFRQELLPKAS